MTANSAFIDKLRDDLGEFWLPRVYLDVIRPLRTRSFDLAIPEKENEPEVMHTLLGIELKVGNVRIPCPDLSHARYLCAFARLGCRSFAIPYDITVLSSIADLLETAWHRTRLVFDSRTDRGQAGDRRKWSATVKRMRQEIGEAGAGEKMPLFNRSTKQRSN